MPASTIIVQHKDGSPARHTRVVLEFRDGVTESEYTNNYGEAVVEHSSAGKATVYVSGRTCGTFHAPGRYAATV